MYANYIAFEAAIFNYSVFISFVRKSMFYGNSKQDVLMFSPSNRANG
jgi:hypothetical protein